MNQNSFAEETVKKMLHQAVVLTALQTTRWLNQGYSNKEYPNVEAIVYAAMTTDFSEE